MTNYWRDHFDQAAARFPRQFLKQVGKTVGGVAVDEGQVSKWHQSVAAALDLGPSDRLVDLCCGNGVLTRSLAQACGSVTGVDFSEGLIGIARAHHAAPNIEYRLADVSTLDAAFFRGFSKACMYEAFQHLDAAQAGALLGAIRNAGTVQRFFIGGVPDRARFNALYDTPDKLAYEAARRAAGQPHIGTWWHRDELVGMVCAAGLRAAVSDQPDDLYASRFRFDCLVTLEADHR